MTKRILVLSGDILPYPGLPTTGAGLRAWGLGKGLEATGHEVVLAMPRSAVEHRDDLPETLQSLLYEKTALPAFLERHAPDVVICQHWHLANCFEVPAGVPLVIDLHGPLLLEVLFQDNPALDGLRRAKINALRKADFFTCAGSNQKYYFQAWLLMAGHDLRQPVIEVIPVSVSPELPPHGSDDEAAFVYGGVFLPWQDPVAGLTTLVECLERRQQGRLKFFGGKHPVVAAPTRRFEALNAQLRHSARVTMMPTIPRDRLIQEYCRATAAFDVMQRNAERELAFTTRTVEYLWCGLPVIYNDYAELAGYIREYQAGWALDPQDAPALRSVIDSILDDPALVAERSANAQRLVRERLTWDRTIAPLDAFCRAPVQRDKMLPALVAGTPSATARVTALQQKLRFHLEHEGVQKTLARIWKKLLR